jgi:hypothetical protein
LAWQTSRERDTAGLSLGDQPAVLHWVLDKSYLEAPVEPEPAPSLLISNAYLLPPKRICASDAVPLPSLLTTALSNGAGELI